MLNGFGLSKAQEPSRTSASAGGGRGSKRRLGSRIGVIFAAGLLFVFFAVPTQAVNATGAFELDGNASSSTTNSTLPDDWDRVCRQVLGTDCSTTLNTTGGSTATPATAVAFGSQTVATGTGFTGGGSKDPHDISSWAWNKGIGGLPGKDALLNGFAAKYNLPVNATTCPSTTSTCNVVFFGMDRFDNSGDAQNGFWFFQNQVTAIGAGTSGSGSPFSGIHKNGDVLVVSDFSVGGGTSIISVYKWNSVCTAAGKPTAACADTNLELLQTSNAAGCLTSSNPPFCGIVSFDPTPGTNPADDLTPAPWSFTDKSGITSFQPGEFYEGGINLSSFPSLANECFASTLAESRSSTSTDATLKSFVLENFGGCGSTIVTTPSQSVDTQIPTTAASLPLPGASSLSETDSAKIMVTGVSTFGGTVQFSLCFNPAINCVSGGTPIGSPVGVTGSSGTATVPSPTAIVTSVGTYCWRAVYSGDSSVGVPGASDPSAGPPPSTSTSECFRVTPVTPTLSTQATIAGTPANTTNVPAMISDTAMLGGTANEPGSPVINPTTLGADAVAMGTITFAVFGPNNPCGGTPLFTSTASVTGDGPYSSGSFTVNVPGTYTFVATYGGDSPNTNGAAVTSCPDTGTEHVTATDTSSATSTQSWVPNDMATVKSTSGQPDLKGTLTIQLYTGTGCVPANAVTLHSYSTIVSGAATATVSSTNTDQVNGDASWLVTFTSTDPNVSSPPSHCENTSLTITN